MSEITINVSWEYFLGTLGTLIALAYYANGRFTRLEISVEWLKDTLRGLHIASENKTAKLFDTNSPVSLTKTGYRVLKESGLEAYIDRHQDNLASRCTLGQRPDPYKLQNCSFRLLADFRFDPEFEQRLNEFAFANGLSAGLLRRAGAIYLRDLVLQSR